MLLEKEGYSLWYGVTGVCFFFLLLFFLFGLLGWIGFKNHYRYQLLSWMMGQLVLSSQRVSSWFPVSFKTQMSVYDDAGCEIMCLLLV